MYMVKNNTGKKISLIRDELKITGGGLYCFMPFEKLDSHKKAIFKVGYTTTSIDKRGDDYYGYFPNGFYVFPLTVVIEFS